MWYGLVFMHDTHVAGYGPAKLIKCLVSFPDGLGMRLGTAYLQHL